MDGEIKIQMRKIGPERYRDGETATDEERDTETV
jgi:hypothetical protein